MKPPAAPCRALKRDVRPRERQTDNYDPSTPAQCEFVNSFQSAVLQLFEELPGGTGIYSSTCYVHCISGQNSWYQFQARKEQYAGSVGQVRSSQA